MMRSFNKTLERRRAEGSAAGALREAAATNKWSMLLLALLPALASCAPPSPREEELVDVRPTRLERGDTLIVEGRPVRVPSQRGLALDPGPLLRAKNVETTVLLDGSFSSLDRPKAEGPDRRRIALPAVAVPAAANPEYSERVLARIDDVLAVQLRVPTAFEGKVGVSQQAKGGETVTFWLGTEAPVRLKLFAPSMRSLSELLVDHISYGRVLTWLGIQAEASPDGLRVTEVAGGPASGCASDETCGSDYLCNAGRCVTRAAEAGLQPGDRISRIAGHDVRTPAELAAAVRTADPRAGLGVGIKRGVQEIAKTIPLHSRPFVVPVSVVQLTVMLVFAVIALTVFMVISGVLTWVERRVAGKMQSRVGPNRVGPLGALQWLADGIKLVLKEDIIPDAVDRPLFKFAPYLVFMGVLGTFVVLPFSQMLIISDLNIGLLYLIAITGFVAIGLMMAGWSSNNKWSLLGGMRSAAQIMSYEVPAGLALMVPVIAAGTLSTQELVLRQGGWPWQWHAFDNPLIFGCFFIYFVSALAEGNRTPFDLPEAESELVAGYNIEYSGWRFAVFFLSEWANLFVVGAVATTVFLGGWQVPGLSPADQAGSLGWQLLGLCFFFAKSMALVFVIIWIRWTLPRFRVDQMMRLCWKYFVPWTFAAVLFQAFWVWVMPPAGRSMVQVLTFVVCGLGLLFVFGSRVVHNWSKNPEEKWSWNPFP